MKSNFSVTISQSGKSDSNSFLFSRRLLLAMSLSSLIDTDLVIPRILPILPVVHAKIVETNGWTVQDNVALWGKIVRVSGSIVFCQRVELPWRIWFDLENHRRIRLASLKKRYHSFDRLWLDISHRLEVRVFQFSSGMRSIGCRVRLRVSTRLTRPPRRYQLNGEPPISRRISFEDGWIVSKNFKTAVLSRNATSIGKIGSVWVGYGSWNKLDKKFKHDEI